MPLNDKIVGSAICSFVIKKALLFATLIENFMAILVIKRVKLKL
jgi:hypothetical protein